MKYLLDTHVFLWALMKPHRLSPQARKAIESAGNENFLSVVSFWEIALKFSLGTLDLKGVTPAEMPPAS